MKICPYCDEPVLPGDPIAPFSGRWFAPTHWECGLRSVVGGINHLNGLCCCCGGTLQPDPEGVSRRTAARMAAQAWLARQGNQ
jgi:hypothetical protein